jgi:hypothetical protein
MTRAGHGTLRRNWVDKLAFPNSIIAPNRGSSKTCSRFEAYSPPTLEAYSPPTGRVTVKVAAVFDCQE